jgi:hypothetical protein
MGKGYPEGVIFSHANYLDKLTYADVIWDKEPLDTETMVGDDWVYSDMQLAQGTEEMLCKQVPLEAPILLEELNQDPNEVNQNSSDKTIAGSVRMALRMHTVVRDAVTMLSAYGDVDFAPALHILSQHGYTMVLAIPSSVRAHLVPFPAQPGSHLGCRLSWDRSNACNKGWFGCSH